MAKKTGKWLAKQLGKDPSTVSKWCSNKMQPSLEMLMQIAEKLDVDVRCLIVTDWVADGTKFKLEFPKALHTK
jgi:transcriptional regulator with XRE-family HTH domain